MPALPEKEARMRRIVVAVAMMAALWSAAGKLRSGAYLTGSHEFTGRLADAVAGSAPAVPSLSPVSIVVLCTFLAAIGIAMVKIAARRESG
jgi:hypothetical protein